MLTFDEEFKKLATHYYHCWLQARECRNELAILEFQFARCELEEMGKKRGFDGAAVNLWFKVFRDAYAPEKASFDKFLGDFYAAVERRSIPQ